MHRFQSFCEASQEDERSLIAHKAFQDQDQLYRAFGHEFRHHESQEPPSFNAFFSSFSITSMCVHHLSTNPDERMNPEVAGKLLEKLQHVNYLFDELFWDPKKARINTIKSNPHN
jgi:hypothetical protein